MADLTENRTLKKDREETQRQPKEKLSPVVLSPKSYRQLERVAEFHEMSVGRTMKDIAEHTLKRIINGQYDIEPKEKEKPRRILVNQSLLSKVRDIAKANNYTLNELLEKIIVEEHLKQAMNRGKKPKEEYQRLFLDEGDETDVRGSEN